MGEESFSFRLEIRSKLIRLEGVRMKKRRGWKATIEKRAISLTQIWEISFDNINLVKNGIERYHLSVTRQFTAWRQVISSSANLELTLSSSDSCRRAKDSRLAWAWLLLGGDDMTVCFASTERVALTKLLRTHGCSSNFQFHGILFSLARPALLSRLSWSGFWGKETQWVLVSWVLELISFTFEWIS